MAGCVESLWKVYKPCAPKKSPIASRSEAGKGPSLPRNREIGCILQRRPMETPDLFESFEYRLWLRDA